MESAHGLEMHLPLTGVNIPKIGKRGFRSQTTPISPHHRKSPFLYRAPQGKWGVFLTQRALFWGTGKWEFLTPNPSFPDFGDFDPCRGRTRF